MQTSSTFSSTSNPEPLTDARGPHPDHRSTQTANGTEAYGKPPNLKSSQWSASSVRTITACLAFCVLFCHSAPRDAFAGEILSQDFSVTEKTPGTPKAHENLLDGMDVFSLSPSAKMLFLPRPMVTRELATAMRRGAHRPPAEAWRGIIARASARHGLPEDLIEAVIRTESSFQADALSPKGAQGAMQIMPGTQAALGLVDPWDPEANVMAGCEYLRRQLDKFGTLELALAAYNAGPANVKKYGGIPPFPETRGYVRKIMSELNRQPETD